MWAITPTYAVIIAFLSWALLCWMRIWSAPVTARNPNSVSAAIRRVFRILFAFLGIYLIDIIVRLLVLDLISYGSFRDIAAPVILCTALGIVYIIRGVLISPDRINLLSFGFMVGAYAWLSATQSYPQLRNSLYLGMGLALFLSIMDMIRDRRIRMQDEPGGKEPGAARTTLGTPVWDVSHRFAPLTTPIAYVVVLVVISTELVLQFEGLSLFRLW
jgi:hypothetical protein